MPSTSAETAFSLANHFLNFGTFNDPCTTHPRVPSNAVQ